MNAYMNLRGKVYDGYVTNVQSNQVEVDRSIDGWMMLLKIGKYEAV